MSGSCPVHVRTGQPYGAGFRVLTPPVLDGLTVEGESQRLELWEPPPPPIIFKGAEVSPVLMPNKHARVWEYGDLFTVGLRKLEDRGVLLVRVQSSAMALWTSRTSYYDALLQLAEAYGVAVSALRTTRADVAVDVEGLDVTHELVDYCVGHRGGLGGGATYKPFAGGGRQIEIGQRRAAKRFIRIYLKTAQDCTAYVPTWLRQGYSGGRVVRVEVEFKNGGLPDRSPFWYVDDAHIAALYGDAVTRYRIAATPENSTRAGVKRASRRERVASHPAWAALTDRAAKWMAPPVPKWTKEKRLDAAKLRATRALGAIAARMQHRHAEMDDIDATLATLRALGHGIVVQLPPSGEHDLGWRWQVVGPPRPGGLDEEVFQRARADTEKREALLDRMAADRAREEQPSEPDRFITAEERRRQEEAERAQALEAWKLERAAAEEEAAKRRKP